MKTSAGKIHHKEGWINNLRNAWQAFEKIWKPSSSDACARMAFQNADCCALV